MISQVSLGNTGLTVPRLFLGTGSYTLRHGSAQAEIPPEKYSLLLKKAFASGINFWDTSNDYQTERHLRAGMAGIPREKLVIATKTYADTPDKAWRDLQNSLHELDTSYIDIYHLHAVDSMEEYEIKVRGPLTALLEAKKLGKVKAIGLSTHNIHVLEKAIDHPELDIIFTNYNKYEIHMDASLQWYTKCLEQAFSNDKGVLVMKTIGEGKLHDRAAETIQYNLSRPFIHSVCVGIVSANDLNEAIAASHSENPVCAGHETEQRNPLPKPE